MVLLPRTTIFSRVTRRIVSSPLILLVMPLRILVPNIFISMISFTFISIFYSNISIVFWWIFSTLIITNMQLINLQHTFWTVKSTLIRLIFFYLLVDILLLNHMGYTVHSKVRRVECNRCYCVQCHWCCCCCSYWRCVHKHAHSSKNCVSILTEMNGSYMRHNNRLTGTHSNRSTIVKKSFRWIFAFFSAIALHLNGILTEIVCFHSLQNPNWIENTNVTSFPENKSSFFL